MQIFKKLIILVLFLSSFSMAAKSYGDLVVDTIWNVHDGDTFLANVSDIKGRSLHPLIGYKVYIRLDSINAPEINDKRDSIRLISENARDTLATRLYKGKKIILKNVKRDEHFRIDATILVDGININKVLMDRGLAKFYLGKTKAVW